MLNLSNLRTLLIFCLLLSMTACSTMPKETTFDRPKIVVGLMVDQMRWDYLYRFWDRYGDGGFKRLLGEGFSCENTLIPYVPTVTACGHTSVYTGSVPAINGIVSNSWYSREKGHEIYCVADSQEKIVGTDSDEMGRSPRNLLTTTIGDELRIATNYQSKVVGIAIKDRAAILPAGHTANGAFWRNSGNFVTSTYYMDALPDWAKQFNAINWKDSLMPEGWKTLYPIETYTLSTEDDKYYEGTFDGEKKPIFPHTKASITSSPFGNALTLEFAKAAVEGYQLGESEFTDFLAVSLSSPDKIGHRFGPNSIEIEDNYLRLDKRLEKFFAFLDNRFGKKGYLLFLTADHGANQSPGYLKEHNIPSGAINMDKAVKNLAIALKKEYGTADLVVSIDNGEVYLDYKALEKRGLNKSKVAAFIAARLKQVPGIANAFTSATLSSATLPGRIKSMYINGTHPTRTGDVLIMRSAGWKTGSLHGASHGDWYPYDAHIPLVWMGWRIRSGKTHRTIHMTDIAPTVAALLHIQMPSGTVGDVITEVTD